MNKIYIDENMIRPAVLCCFCHALQGYHRFSYALKRTNQNCNFVVFHVIDQSKLLLLNCVMLRVLTPHQMLEHYCDSLLLLHCSMQTATMSMMA